MTAEPKDRCFVLCCTQHTELTELPALVYVPAWIDLRADFVIMLSGEHREQGMGGQGSSSPLRKAAVSGDQVSSAKTEEGSSSWEESRNSRRTGKGCR